MRRNRCARRLAKLRRRLRALRPDIVHAISLKSGPYGGVAARAAGVPMVWHLHDHLVPSYLAPRLIMAVQGLILLIQMCLTQFQKDTRLAVKT